MTPNEKLVWAAKFAEAVSGDPQAAPHAAWHAVVMFRKIKPPASADTTEVDAMLEEMRRDA